MSKIPEERKIRKEVANMTFFQEGATYRGIYQIERVIRFFQGELAIGNRAGQRYYLQHANLQQAIPVRSIQQYRYLEHPCLLPYQDVLIENQSIVWIRPYEPITPLLHVASSQEVSEAKAVEWLKMLLEFQQFCQSKPMPMFVYLDLRNIGVNESGEFRVLFVGLEKYLQPNNLDWGTFLYCILTGQNLDGPLVRVPSNFPVTKPMNRLISKMLREFEVDTVLPYIEQFERSQQGSSSLFRRLFSNEKANPINSTNSSRIPTSEVQMDTNPNMEDERSKVDLVLELHENMDTLDYDSKGEVQVNQQEANEELEANLARPESMPSIIVSPPRSAHEVDEEIEKANRLVEKHRLLLAEAKEKLATLQSEQQRQEVATSELDTVEILDIDSINLFEDDEQDEQDKLAMQFEQFLLYGQDENK